LCGFSAILKGGIKCRTQADKIKLI